MKGGAIYLAQLNNLIVTGSSRFLNKVYFSNDGTFNGNINIDNGGLQIYGKTALMGYDSWLRINEPKHFTSGIYCGNGTLRTDGEFQVGDNGNCFKANSSAITCNRSLIVNAGVDFGYGATIRNAGLELYFSTPFIDFHFNNSNKDFTSRIIESKESVLSINGVTCSSSNLAANNVSATNVNVSSRINADAATAIFNNVYVKDELRSTTWAIDNITNLGSTFYVSPCVIFTNPSVYINSKSGTTVTLTITDNNIISSTIGGQTWTSGSKIKLMGRINTSVLGVVNGTMVRQLNTTTAKTAYITLNFATTNDCAGIEQGKTYSGSAIGDLKMMMYEVNLNVNGITKNRPVGIRMSSYNEDKKSSIDIYNGTVDDGKPVVRMGVLDELPAVNGEKPTGYGFYAVGNAFFSGRIVSGSGKIGNWNIGTDSLYVPNKTGISSNTGKFAFWAGESNNKNGASDTNAVFRVGHNGVLIATNAAITGIVTATSGAIGSFTLDSTYLQSSDKTVGLSATASDWAFWAGGANTNNAKFRVNHAGQLWATSATITGSITATSGRIGNCSIENGRLVLGDTMNYANLNANTYGNYGFKLVADGNNNPWFQHSPQRDIQISPVDYNSYKCNGGEWFRIEFEFASTVQATATDNYGANTYVNINIGLYGIKTNGASCWFIPFGGRSNSSGTVQKVSTAVQLDSDVRSFSVCIQCAGSGTFSGTLKIRNVSVYRMMGNELIVDGAITAAKIKSGEVTSDKIAANAITADKINVSQLSAISADLGSITGGSINIGNGKFKVDSSGNFTATNGSLTGTVNATTMRAKQSISVYSDTFDTYQKIIEWSGQSGLNIGLIGDGKTSGVSGASIILYGKTIYCYDDLSVLLNLNVGKNLVAETISATSTISANSIDATAIYTNNKNTSMGVNLYTSGTLTVKSGTTLKSTLHVDGESGFYGKVTARSSFAFLDYNAEEDANATAVFRRPIASAGSNKTKVAFLQSQTGNKISIRAQYGSTSWGTATFTGSSSDIRLKRDIKDSSVNALSKIMQMQIREFNWKQTGVHQELGCVADELELIDPLLTTGGGYDKDGTMNVKCINTLLLTEYNSKAIQELGKENERLNEEIIGLRQQLSKTRGIVESILKRSA
ncbi:hypothetical protein HMPREF1547_00097 [Blautia sp. KLE 1732]|nr:hypothetical protein HMPREF1547_00097 [Blautia sp. KLE 1732]